MKVRASDKEPIYRFPVPQQMTPEALLHAARRLAEAAREGYDLPRAVIEERFIVVPLRGLRTAVIGGRIVKMSTTERTARYREEIVGALRKDGPLTASTVARRVRLTNGQVRYLLQTLVAAGQVRRIDNVYEVVEGGEGKCATQTG